MQSDKLFYQILLLFPELISELVEQELNSDYSFSAPVVKALERRLDGLLTPESEDSNEPLIFVEAQMRPDPKLYRRIFCQLGIYFEQYNASNPWLIIVIYPDKGTEVLVQPQVMSALNLTRIHLDQLEGEGSIGWKCLQLIGAESERVPKLAQTLVQRVKSSSDPGLSQTEIIRLISIIVSRKLPELSQQEIKEMLNLAPIEMTKPFQEGKTEGKAEGKAEGLREGKLEGKLEIAQNLLNEGMTVDDVVRLTGLSVSELEELL